MSSKENRNERNVTSAPATPGAVSVLQAPRDRLRPTVSEAAEAGVALAGGPSKSAAVAGAGTSSLAIFESSPAVLGLLVGRGRRGGRWIIINRADA